MELGNFGDLLGKKEPLHEDLLEYYSNKGNFPVIQHPLLYSVPHNENYNALMNKRYVFKKKHAEELLKNGKHEAYVFLHERPFRLNAFIEVMDELKNKIYWELLADIWRDSENIWQNKSTWKELLCSDREGSIYFMSEDDRETFFKFPDTITVYRGVQQKGDKKGFSYTTDEEKAFFFANRYRGEGEVIVKKVKKSDIFAYTNERNEKEVIILK